MNQKNIEKLKEICKLNNISYETVTLLLNSVKTKKILKRNNYHHTQIEDILNKEKNENTGS